MRMIEQKTIAAISTAQAPGGIGIVRLSGDRAKEIAEKIFVPKGRKKISEVPGYTSLYGSAVDENGERVDEALALVFTAPKSYTGEDVVEISCHGGMFIMRRILALAIRAGAVPAQAGEFTKRAFLNGRIDLTRAESVMQLISASGEDAAKAAASGNEGVLQRKIEAIRDSLVSAAAHLTAWADYPDEEVPEITEEELSQTFSKAQAAFSKLLREFDSGRMLREGVKTVIAGRPNVGKSTLMNLLSGYDRSIVTEHAGTTRDIVEDVINFAGIPLYIADTAGIHDTQDPIESIGVDRAVTKLSQAQLVFAVFDSSEELTEEDLSLIGKIGNIPAIAVFNKSDLPQKADRERIRDKFSAVVPLCAKDGEGLDKLEEAVVSLLRQNPVNPSEGVLFTERQRDVVERANEALSEAASALAGGMTFDAVTVSLEGCISALLELTGERISDTVIDEVFSKFCVGK
ncbi:MAG: tRNA uridine-5-carboxymethylaminomethyl(34) synthesis GTPase MnmE [Clostridia bacterium]|nr:tRNA uridine-5-carboxymethylaminomethyl(34) synthesis GTPase MnmE [Clostridia bacterium]